MSHLVASSAGVGVASSLVGVVFALLEIFSLWRVFTKAGQAGWKSIIPIYNVAVELKIAGRPAWWLLLFLVPFVNIVFGIMALHSLSKSFGKGGGFTVGLLLLPFIFYPVLAFGTSTYVGPGGGSRLGGGVLAPAF